MIEYRDIPDYPGYRVGNDGTVWSAWTKSRPSYISEYWNHLAQSNTKGSLQVTLCNDYGNKNILVHQLVLNAFVRPCPDGMECRHLDGNFKNNNLWNICWGTKAENEADRVLHGTILIGEENGNSVLTEEQVLDIRFKRIVMRLSQRAIAKMFNISQAHVSDIEHRKVWKHI